MFLFKLSQSVFSLFCLSLHRTHLNKSFAALISLLGFVVPSVELGVGIVCESQVANVPWTFTQYPENR